MIDISFLSPIRLSGLTGFEYLNFQNNSLHKELTEALEDSLDDDNGILYFREGNKRNIKDIVFKHTGINIKLNTDEFGNLAVDSGYLLPGHLLNNKNIDLYLDKKFTKIAEAFKDLKTNVIKGWIDTKTGMVGGTYSEIEFDVYINTMLHEFLDRDIFTKLKASPAAGIAAFLIHELGHIFSGFMFISKYFIDYLIPLQAIKMVKGAEGVKQRTVILKETLAELECDGIKDIETIADANDPEEITVIFNKAIKNRDLRRTLSLGAHEKSSEVFADAYAIRMGCGRDLVYGLVSLNIANSGDRISMLSRLVILTLLGILITNPIIVGLSLFSILVTGIATLTSTLASGTYDTPYRRIKNILRENILVLTNDKTLDNKNKLKLLEDSKNIEKVIESQKTILEGTGVQRLIGWICSGSDFRKQDFEHYTEELLANNLALYQNYFNSKEGE